MPLTGRDEGLFLSVVIPAYNEGAVIGESLRRVRAFLELKGRPWEIIVSSDGSTDQTAVIVEKAAAESRGQVRLLHSPLRRGKGAAVRDGVLASSGRYALITDCDLSSPIKESDKLLAALESGGFQVAIGSRGVRAPGCDVRQTFKRRLAGRLFNVIVRSLTGLPYKDTQCGFKCFTREAASTLFRGQKTDGFAFDVELLVLARAAGFRVSEVPVMWAQGPSSKVRLVSDSVRMVGEILKIRSSAA